MRVVTHDVEAWIELMTRFAVLAGFATAEACEALRADAGLDELRALNDATHNALAVDDYRASTKLKWEFHQRIFDSTPHAELRRSLSETWQRQHIVRLELWGTIPLRAMRRSRSTSS
jgi:DNA-binding GntR family transcriptional regulator